MSGFIPEENAEIASHEPSIRALMLEHRRLAKDAMSLKRVIVPALIVSNISLIVVSAWVGFYALTGGGLALLVLCIQLYLKERKISQIQAKFSEGGAFRA